MALTPHSCPHTEQSKRGVLPLRPQQLYAKISEPERECADQGRRGWCRFRARGGDMRSGGICGVLRRRQARRWGVPGRCRWCGACATSH